jgi:hypothetical protein
VHTTFFKFFKTYPILLLFSKILLLLIIFFSCFSTFILLFILLFSKILLLFEIKDEVGLLGGKIILFWICIDVGCVITLLFSLSFTLAFVGERKNADFVSSFSALL